MKYKKGFTLIELLVVIAIIGLLAAVILASLNIAREKGADSRRKADLQQIRTALELHYSNCGSYVVAVNCTGAKYGSNGFGYFNVSYGNGSMAKGLVDNGLTKTQIIDPTGNVSSAKSYMIATDQNHYTIWATITRPSAADSATLNSCYFSGYDNYNYFNEPGYSRNYCISN